MVGFFWFISCCWATNGLFSWPEELLVDNVVRIWLVPNGLVLLGRAGIKFSKLTNEEFSPKKLSGVLHLASNLSPGFCELLSCVGNISDGLVEFQGLVELLVVPGSVEVPKKSPKGSVLGLFFEF